MKEKRTLFLVGSKFSLSLKLVTLKQAELNTGAPGLLACKVTKASYKASSLDQAPYYLAKPFQSPHHPAKLSRCLLMHSGSVLVHSPSSLQTLERKPPSLSLKPPSQEQLATDPTLLPLVSTTWPFAGSPNDGQRISGEKKKIRVVEFQNHRKGQLASRIAIFCSQSACQD